VAADQWQPVGKKVGAGGSQRGRCTRVPSSGAGMDSGAWKVALEAREEVLEAREEPLDIIRSKIRV
jgi:hypothetical protein